jgi:hypothetical protein
MKNVNGVIYSLFLVVFLFTSHAFSQESSGLKKPQKSVDLKELSKECECSLEDIIRVTKLYPTLKGREIGEALLDEAGKKQVWKRTLPFFAQEVLDLGFELPKTYGFAIIPNILQQDLILKDLKVGFNGSELQEIDFVQFGTARADNQNLQLKADVWLFPFLNIYTTYGKMKGEADTPISIEGYDLLGFLGINCDGIFAPKQCNQTYSAIVTPEYTGSNISIGFNLAMGWDRFFVTLPVTYVVTELNILDDNIKTLQISPRIGISSDAGNWGTMATFIGVTYLNADLDVAGRISFDLTGVPGINDTVDLDYLINQENADKINYVIGFNWDVSKSWSFHSEAGFGGSREGFITSMTYRF